MPHCCAEAMRCQRRRWRVVRVRVHMVAEQRVKPPNKWLKLYPGATFERSHRKTISISQREHRARTSLQVREGPGRNRTPRFACTRGFGTRELRLMEEGKTPSPFHHIHGGVETAPRSASIPFPIRRENRPRKSILAQGCRSGPVIGLFEPGPPSGTIDASNSDRRLTR